MKKIPVLANFLGRLAIISGIVTGCSSGHPFNTIPQKKTAQTLHLSAFSPGEVDYPIHLNLDANSRDELKRAILDFILAKNTRYSTVEQISETTLLDFYNKTYDRLYSIVGKKQAVIFPQVEPAALVALSYMLDKDRPYLPDRSADVLFTYGYQVTELMPRSERFQKQLEKVNAEIQQHRAGQLLGRELLPRD